MKLQPVIILAAGLALSAGVLLFCLPEQADTIPAGSETERQLWLFGQGYKGREIGRAHV